MLALSLKIHLAVEGHPVSKWFRTEIADVLSKLFLWVLHFETY